MPMYAKDNELRRKMREWFKTNDQRHKLGEITYSFASYKYDQVRVALNALVTEGLVKKEKINGHMYEYWLNGSGIVNDGYKMFFTLKPTEPKNPKIWG